MQDAITFISILLQDNQNMKNLYAKYLNSRVTFNALYPPTKDEPIEAYKKRIAQSASAEENQELTLDANNFRAYVVLVNTNFNSIKKHMKLKKEHLDLIEEAYNQIIITLLPDITASQTFIQEINDLLAEYINVAALVNAEQKASDLARATQIND